MPTSTPAKQYAVVLADGTTEEFKTKKQAIARGEYSGQAFTVLSPRGFEVHVYEMPEPAAVEKPSTVLAEELAVGTTATGTCKKDPVREIARVRVGRVHVTAWDAEGKAFGYWARGTEVEVSSE